VLSAIEIDVTREREGAESDRRERRRHREVYSNNLI
jgi:hypothetical protein